MKLSDIIIPYDFKTTEPKDYKLIACMKYYNKFGRLDKPITVNVDNYLVDGYARYLTAKAVGMEDVPVKRVVGDCKVYVKAQHCTGGKCYWWMVRKNDVSAFLEKVKEDDQIVVDTRKGLSTVTVNEIVVKPSPPVNRKIKTVVKF